MKLSACNGRIVSGRTELVSIDAGGFLYGDSLFETLRAEQRKLLWVDEHLQRLSEGCRLSALPFDEQMARQGLEEVCRRLPWPSARIRLTVSRGEPGADAAQQFVTGQPYQPPTPDAYRAGVQCVYAPNQRVNSVSHLPQMKRGNYADCIYAARHARANNAFEALFCTAEGDLLEGAISNLFVLLDGVLLTPPAGELVLPGIARGKILTAAKKAGLPALEHPLHRQLLRHATEAFISNSLFGLLPVRSIAGQQIASGPAAQTLRHFLGKPFSDADSA